MLKNGKFYVTLNTSRLVDEFRAAAGCKTTEQAIDAMFLVSSTLISDHLMKVNYTDKDRTGKKWNFSHAVKAAMSAPEFKNTDTSQEESCPMPMNPDRYVQLGSLEGHVYLSTGRDITISEAFTLAAVIGRNLCHEYGQGHALKLPVDIKRGNPLTERHIHLLS